MKCTVQNYLGRRSWMVIAFGASTSFWINPPYNNGWDTCTKLNSSRTVLVSRFKRKVAVPTIFQGHSGIVKVLGEELQFVVTLDYFQNTFSKCEEFSLHPGNSSCWTTVNCGIHGTSAVEIENCAKKYGIFIPRKWRWISIHNIPMSRTR